MHLNRSALSDDIVVADQPNKENDLIDHALEILNQAVAAREQTLSEADVNLLALILEIAHSYEVRPCGVYDDET
jgi:hypothetical protein